MIIVAAIVAMWDALAGWVMAAGSWVTSPPVLAAVAAVYAVAGLVLGLRRLRRRS
jgi:ribose/xylose/arabinose/galactoside ABC-type transport system permease subunit